MTYFKDVFIKTSLTLDQISFSLFNNRFHTFHTCNVEGLQWTDSFIYSHADLGQPCNFANSHFEVLIIKFHKLYSER